LARLEFDTSDVEEKSDGNDEDKHGNVVETGICYVCVLLRTSKPAEQKCMVAGGTIQTVGSEV
jgi:hypothetical protein